MKIRIVIIPALILAFAAAAHAADVRVSVGEVKDTRSTGKFFNELEIQLKLTGDDVPEVKGVKATVNKAVDSTGRNILKKEERPAGFDSFREPASGQAEVTLKLKNPARKAATISELAGELRLFMPERDTASIVVVKGLPAKTGKPLTDPVLLKHKVEVTVLTKTDYDALVKKQEEEKLRAEAAKQGLTDAMMQMMEGFMGMFFDVGEHDIILKIKDPGEKLIDVELLDGKGAELKSHGTMTTPDLRVLNFKAPLPSDAQLRIFIGTEKAITTTPFRLTDIALP